MNKMFNKGDKVYMVYIAKNHPILREGVFIDRIKMSVTICNVEWHYDGNKRICPVDEEQIYPTAREAIDAKMKEYSTLHNELYELYIRYADK